MAFPTDLILEQDGFAEQPADGVIATKMENGIVKQAKVNTRVMVDRPVKYVATSLAIYQSWQTYYTTTINRGADWFDWPDPVSNTTKSARIKAGSYRGAVPRGGLLNTWDISFVLQTWE